MYLQHVARAYPDQPILLLWDHAPHHKGDAVKAFLKANPRLEVMWFPAGAPDTNPQEHVCHAHRLDTLTQVVNTVERHLTSHTFASSLLRDHAYADVHAMFNCFVYQVMNQVGE